MGEFCFGSLHHRNVGEQPFATQQPSIVFDGRQADELPGHGAVTGNGPNDERVGKCIGVIEQGGHHMGVFGVDDAPDESRIAHELAGGVSEGLKDTGTHVLGADAEAVSECHVAGDAGQPVEQVLA